MLFLAALLHAIIILGLTFTAGEPAKSEETPALEVLLVTDELPAANRNDQAVYLAQRTQRGSGNTDAPLAAGSPAPRAPMKGSLAPQQGDADEEKPAVGEQALLASSGAAADMRYFAASTTPRSAAEPLPDIEADTVGEPRSGRGDAEQLTLRGKAHGDLWITPDTREAQLAPYVAAWKRKVERVGTVNFPAAARSAGLSGSPVVEVAIRSDGRLVEAQVRRSSGYAAIDEAALSILKLASPFDPFPVSLAANYETLRFAYQWEFVGGQLEPGTVTSSSDTAYTP